MIKVIDVFEKLNTRFPVNTACDFDNVGILIGDRFAEVEGVLVCLDCTFSAIEKAKSIGANLIITHHPVIFDPLKAVNENSVVFALIKNSIAVISMHTNLDVGAGGVNDCLCDVLGLENIKKHTASDGYILNRAETNISDPVALADGFKKRLNFPVRFVAGRPIKNVLVCSGSGGGYITEAVLSGFDGLITADVKQNHFVEALNAGISLFDCGHYASENVCVAPLAEMIKSDFPEIEAEVFSPDFIKFN